MHGLQIRLTLVQRVTLAIVVKCEHPAARRRANLALESGVLVDVVPQKHYGVEVFFTHMPPGSKVAVLPLLTRGVTQSKSIHGSAWFRKGPGTPDRADRIPCHKTVEIPTVGFQTSDLHMHRMRQVCVGCRLTTLHNTLKLVIVRHLPTHRHWIGSEAAGR